MDRDAGPVNRRVRFGVESRPVRGLAAFVCVLPVDTVSRMKSPSLAIRFYVPSAAL